MNIAFRTDSSYDIGTGHVYRCLNLAKRFKKKKINCYFFSKQLSGNINDLIIKEFELFKLGTAQKNNYSNKENINDADLTINLIKKLNIDLIFLDNYFLNDKWEKKVSNYCKLILISDYLDRKSYCNYYINYNLLCENNSIKKKLRKDCKKLIGADYLIVKHIPKLNKNKIKNKIVVFMGGVDSKNLTGKLISILSDNLFLKFEKNIIIGQRNRNYKIISEQIDKTKNFKIVVGDKKNLFRYFINSKLVITGLGTTMYEHLALGLNSIIIAQNSLHKKIIKSLSSYKLINFINNLKNLNKNLIQKTLNQQNFFKKRLKLINMFNSDGSDRIVDYFLSKDILKNASLRKATLSDVFFLFKLINDPKVISNSLTNKYTNINDHENWLKKKINKKKSKIFIFETVKHKFGQIRFDQISTKKTFITYSVSNEFRGNNIGYEMLKLAMEKFYLKRPIYAIVKKKNIISKKIFERLGFEKIRNSKNYTTTYLKNN